jgi:hypothetical protein
MKAACMTRQTLLMFPQMKFLTEQSLSAASAIASGEANIGDGFKVLGRGAFTKAYGNEDYVVKGEVAEFGNAENSAAWNYRNWFRNTYKARHTSKVFARACKKYLAPTVVLFECVVVQEKVEWTGNDFSGKLMCEVDELARMLGIIDMHGANWGVTKQGEVKMFDIMPSKWFPRGQKFTRDAELEVLIAQVELLVAQEVLWKKEQKDR